MAACCLSSIRCSFCESHARAVVVVELVPALLVDVCAQYSLLLLSFSSSPHLPSSRRRPSRQSASLADTHTHTHRHTQAHTHTPAHRHTNRRTETDTHILPWYAVVCVSTYLVRPCDLALCRLQRLRKLSSPLLALLDLQPQRFCAPHSLSRLCRAGLHPRPPLRHLAVVLYLLLLLLLLNQLARERLCLLRCCCFCCCCCCCCCLLCSCRLPLREVVV